MCPFCEVEGRVIDENETAFVIMDKFPVTRYHSLVIPKRHVSSYFELTNDEIWDIKDLLFRQQELLRVDRTITGFNVGINDGEDAGQTIFHCHVHLIPRRKGDVEKPRGGVRGVIPHRQNYVDVA